MPTKLLRPNVGIYIATADAFANADITASGWQPTLAQLTDIAKVFNISPAVTDAYTLNLTDSDSDNSLSIVDNAQVSVPTTYNYEVSLDGFRDSATAADSYFNKFKALVANAAVGTKYYIIKRTGKAHNAAFAVNDIISVFGVSTDYADDLVADGEMIRVGGRFIQTGEVAVNTTVAGGTAGSGPWGTVTDATARPTGTKIQSNGNVAVWWVGSSGVTDEAAFITSPTATIINGTSSVNLTEAIAWDGYTLGATESNKIDDKGIIDRTNSKVRGFAQFSGALTFFRPASPTQAILGSGAANSTTISLKSGALTVTTGVAGTSTLEITAANSGDKIAVGNKVVNVAGVIGLTNTITGTTTGSVFTASPNTAVAYVTPGMKATVVAGTTVGATATVTAVNTTSGAVTLSTPLLTATQLNFSTDVFVTKVVTTGTNPIITLSTAHFGAVSTVTFQADMDKLEVGMKVSGTNVSSGAAIATIDKPNATVTVTSATGGTPIAANTALAITTSYSLAYDTFKAATNSRPSGWLVTRVGKNAASALIATDVVSVFKFTADAVMDDTEGEDSMKFMVNYMPAGLIGVNLTVV